MLLSLLLKFFQEADIAEIYFPVFPEIEKMYGNRDKHRQKCKKNTRIDKLHNWVAVLLGSFHCKINQIRVARSAVLLKIKKARSEERALPGKQLLLLLQQNRFVVFYFESTFMFSFFIGQRPEDRLNFIVWGF